MKEPQGIIFRSIVTEKSTTLQEDDNQYVFEVSKDANKIEIAKAVEKMFDVRVAKVRTTVIRGKIKRVGLNIGRRKSWKKAVVTLAEGENIDLFEGV